jgi:hypothetical protein
MQICIDSTIYLTSRGYHYKLKELVASDRQVLNLGRESKKKFQVLTCYGSELVLPRPWFHKRILFLIKALSHKGEASFLDMFPILPMFKTEKNKHVYGARKSPSHRTDSKNSGDNA